MKLNKILLFSLSTLILTSCNNLSEASRNLKKSKEVEQFVYSTYQDNAFKSFLEKYDSFANDFSANYLLDAETNNFVISPLSLYMAMSLVVESTANNTRQELLNSLNMSYDEVYQYTKDLFEMSSREYINKGQVYYKEQLDNSIWVAPGLRLKEDCLNSLANNYYCSSYEADFKSNNKEANNDVRKYIKDKTNGLIDQDFGFDEEVVMLLMNTLYVKDSWNEFSNLVLSDKKYDFKNYNNQKVSKSLLQGKYVSGSPYKCDDFTSMYTTSTHGYKLNFIVPNDGKDIKDIFTKNNLDNVILSSNYVIEDEQYEYNTRVFFPEFEVKTTSSLVTTLQRMGINDLFNSLTSNFSSISYDDLVCSDVIQSAKLIVNKKGFEGAAVTIFEEKCTSVGPEKSPKYFDFVVDKSFGYVLTDSYNNIIFSGIIYNI